MAWLLRSPPTCVCAEGSAQPTQGPNPRTVVSTLVGYCLPPGMSKDVLSRGLQNPSFLVKFTILHTLTALFGRYGAILSELDGLVEQATASLTSPVAASLALLQQARTQFRQALRRQLPDIQGARFVCSMSATECPAN